jgi:hypothetical protein
VIGILEGVIYVLGEYTVSGPDTLTVVVFIVSSGTFRDNALE